MDIEKTIAFILEQTAKNAAQIARNDAQIAALTASVNALTEAQKKSEKKFEVLGKMVQTGMKLLVKMDKRIDDVAESQSEPRRRSSSSSNPSALARTAHPTDPRGQS